MTARNNASIRLLNKFKFWSIFSWDKDSLRAGTAQSRNREPRGTVPADPVLFVCLKQR